MINIHKFSGSAYAEGAKLKYSRIAEYHDTGLSDSANFTLNELQLLQKRATANNINAQKSSAQNGIKSSLTILYKIYLTQFKRQLKAMNAVAKNEL